VSDQRAREDTLRKVQALLDKASSTTFDAERDALIAKADEMMSKYAIEQFELDMARPAHERERPELRNITVSEAKSYLVRQALSMMFRDLARHCSVMIGASAYVGTSERNYKCVGYRADLDYLQMLFLNVQLHLLSRMEPKPDPDLSDVENFANLREAGLDYDRILSLMGWRKGDGNLKRVRTQYQQLAKSEGREPVRGAKGEAYRTSFLQGYIGRIRDRLWEMKAARETAAEGKGLVLASRDSDLRDRFYEEFPDLKPHPDNCECEDCHTMKCNDDKCTRPRCVELRKQRNKPVRYRAPREVKMDLHAHSLGRSAANTADLAGREGNISNDRKELS
jgi:hypothetical protein